MPHLRVLSWNITKSWPKYHVNLWYAHGFVHCSPKWTGRQRPGRWIYTLASATSYRSLERWNPWSTPRPLVELNRPTQSPPRRWDCVRSQWRTPPQKLHTEDPMQPQPPAAQPVLLHARDQRDGACDAVVGVTKAPFVNLSVRKSFGLAKLSIILFESHSNLTGVAAAELRHHPSIIAMILNS